MAARKKPTRSKPSPEPEKKKIRRPKQAESMRGNFHRIEQGLYSCALIDPEEESIFNNLSLDNLDQEIRMTRLRLRRAFRAEANQHKLLNSDDEKDREKAAVINRIVRGITPDGAVFTRERTVKDYGGDIQRISTQLTRLIELRAQIANGMYNENDEKARLEAEAEAELRMSRMFGVVTEEQMDEAKAAMDRVRKGGDKA